MSNTLTAIIPKILSSGIKVLREEVLMTKFVNTDWGMDTKKQGATIDVPISSAITAADVTPAAVPTAPTDITPTTVQIPLSNWKHADFQLSDKEVGTIRAEEDFVIPQINEAFKSLANAVNDSVFAEYVGIYGITGTAGTTPFGAGVEVASATNANKILNKQTCPRDNRYGMLDWDAQAAALNLDPFSNASSRGSSNTKTTADLGNIFGMDWYADAGTPTHTRGALGAGALTVNGVNAIAATSVSIAKAAGANWSAIEGDIISFAGDDQTYVITADTTVTHTANTSVPISPPLKVATTGGEAVTSTDSHIVNLAFHRDAFALAVRPSDQGLQNLTGVKRNSFTMRDPVSNLIFRLQVIEAYMMTIWDLDILWGVKLIDAAKATRIAG